MRFTPAERIADAVLSEGQVLYPYRASAVKNRMRWQFGVVAPRDPDESLGEPWFTETVCLVEPDGVPKLSLRLRCLHLQERTVDEWDQAASVWRPSAQVTVNGRDLIAWSEAVKESITVEDVALELGAPDSVTIVQMPAGRDVQVVQDAVGHDRARVTRERWSLEASLRVSVAAAGSYRQLRVRLENTAPWQPEYRHDRDAMLRRSLVSAHLVLAIEGGRFISQLDPPADAEALAASGRSLNTYPVLVGDADARNLLLSSPIVLYDYPAIAPQSPGDLCDGLEIDEILSLRIMTLTDDEKREARATDPKAAEIIDRTDALTPGDMAGLHGEMIEANFFNPPGEAAPRDASLMIGDWRVARGVQVRLSPKRRADSMDMFLQDQLATVAAVYRDLEDRAFVAVTVDADPGADLHESFGRYFYFAQDEIEPPDASAPGTSPLSITQEQHS